MMPILEYWAKYLLELYELKPLRKKMILDAIEKSMFSQKIKIFGTIESTNTYANEIARMGAPEGTVVIAENQNAGRGRMGRKWVSPKYANVLMSVIIKPDIKIREIFAINMITTLAVTDAIEEIFGLNSKIKWPNDIYLNMKKVGGILTEISAKGHDIEYVVVGLGLNINWKPENLTEMRYDAISVSEEVGYPLSREEIISSILIKIDLYYKMYSQGMSLKLLELWRERSIILGKLVEIDTGEETISGRVLRVDHRGTLIIENEDGDKNEVIFGDVSVKEIKDESTHNRKDPG
ncbi:biotin--[acetyl-CoA-carboxylase] ligase [Thermodesulfobacteriota bacterium]